MRPRFSTQFDFEWTFYGKLVFKRCLDVQDWFRDKVAFQYKIPFLVPLLRRKIAVQNKIPFREDF